MARAASKAATTRRNLKLVTSEGQALAPPPVTVQITPPNIKRARIDIVGTAPYVMNSMSSETRKKIIEKQELGSVGAKRRNRPPKDFDKIYRGMMHVAQPGGWHGIPCNALRAGLVSACRIVGFQMTKAKLGIIGVEPDGWTKDGTPLVKLTGKPVRRDMPVKLADGSTDILPRPFFEKWSSAITVEWDADMFSAEEITNLVARCGRQVGIGAGRPDSKQSTGMGWGTFRIKA